MFHVAVVVDRWAKSGMDGKKKTRRDGGTYMHGRRGIKKEREGKRRRGGPIVYKHKEAAFSTRFLDSLSPPTHFSITLFPPLPYS